MKERIPQLPDVPTVGEVGLAGAEMFAWFAMFAPAGTPPDVIAKIRDALGVALAKPEVQGKARLARHHAAAVDTARSSRSSCRTSRRSGDR